MTQELLKALTAKELVENHDFPFEAAATAVEGFCSEEPEMFNENASPDELADYLASNSAEV